MRIDNNEAKLLLEKYKAGRCTPREKALLESWYIHWGSGKEVHLSGEQLDIALDEIWKALPIHKEVRRMHPVRWAAAASVLLLLSIGAYYIFHKQAIRPLAQMQADIAPGSNKAILTLSGGQQIILTGAQNGQLSVQGNTIITKTADGAVAYSPGNAGNPEILYNTMSTPRGGQYHLTLSDGSNVWLNAASSIKYPVNFTGPDRPVQVTGEAYFEVAQNAAKPFRVTSTGQTITVLGTRFNVNTYTDEPAVKTTLLEGSVRVEAGSGNVILKPGQQTILSPNGLSVAPADIEDATAWKNGLFRFSDESLESIMRKVSRWYDVDIEYTDEDVKGLPLTGVITHFSNVSKVLRMLELTKQVHFQIQGKKIIVMR